MAREEGASYAISKDGRMFGWGEWYGIRKTQAVPLDITDRLVASVVDIVEIIDNVYLTKSGAIYQLTDQVGGTGKNLAERIIVNPEITITGSNFTDVEQVFVDLNGDGSMQDDEVCGELDVKPDTEMTCEVPTDKTIPTGDYNLYVSSFGGRDVIKFHYRNVGQELGD